MMQAKTDEYYQLNDNMDGKELLPLFVKTTYIWKNNYHNKLSFSSEGEISHICG